MNHKSTPQKLVRTVSALLLILSVMCGSALNAFAQTPLLMNFGATAPTPGVDDLFQLNFLPANPNPPANCANYYFDHNPNPGQTFTTGTNPNGYVLNTVDLRTFSGAGSLPAGGQAFTLRLFSISGGTATLLNTFTSQGGFIPNANSWLRWTNINFGLQPGVQYAYSFVRNTAGWMNMGFTNGTPFAGGELVSIPPAGGTISTVTTHDYSAAFDLGLSVASSVVVNPVTIAPNTVLIGAGTAVTVSANASPAVGSGTISYQWQTDGASGGALTNIPSATSTTLNVDTTGLSVGVYRYALVANNGSSSATSAPVVLNIIALPGVPSLGLKFGNGSASTTMNPDVTGDIAGPAGLRTYNWNNVTATTDFGLTSLSPTDNGGAALVNPANGAGTMATVYTGDLTGNPGGGSGVNDAKLFGSIWDHNEGAEGSVTLTDLPWTNYLVFCYTRPDQGSATSPRGGYWSIRDTQTNTTSITMEQYVTNVDLTITTNVVTTNIFNVATNYVASRWMKGQDAGLPGVPTPDANGNGYLQSFTSVQPTTFAGIQQGNYVAMPGDPNPMQVNYTTNIDLTLTPATTNVVVTTNYSTTIYFTAVGGGAYGVNGGDSARRFKVAGLQIIKIPSTTPTNIVVTPAIPNLLAGSTTPTAFNAAGQYAEGYSFPLALLSSTIYTSTDTNIFTVASGFITPRHAGTANLVTTSGSTSMTQAVTVLPPVAISIPALNPSLLYKGNNAADTLQAQLLANFDGYLTNAALSNVNVAAFSFVNFTATPGGVVNVTAGGLVTAAGTNNNGVFSLHATFEGLTADLNNAGTVVMLPQLSKVACFGANICDAGNLASFKDLTGAPGNRQAYWNNLIYNVGSTTTPSNAVVNPWDYQGNTLTGCTMVWTSIGFGAATATITTNEYRIIHYAYDAGGAGPSTITNFERPIVITNVPYAAYDAYFYFYNDGGNPRRVGHVTAYETKETRWRRNGTIPGSLDNIAPNPATGAGYLQAVPLIANGSIPNGVYPAGTNEVPVGNYIKFTGLTNPIAIFGVGPDGSLTVSDADNTERLRLAAFQIVKNLSAMTPTNIYLSQTIGGLFPGNPVGTTLAVFADFTDGTVGGNITELASYSSSNTNVFSVTTNGVITAGLTPGTANLVVTFNSMSLTQAVTTLAPLSVKVKAKPDTAYIDGANGAQAAALQMFATFAGYTNVNVSSFGSVSWNDVSPSVAYVTDTANPPTTSPVTIQPVTVGTANLSGNYAGATYTSLAGFNVRSVSDPISLTNQTNLKHRYSFRDAPNSTVIVDSVGGANGIVMPGLAGSFPLTLDGENVNFPANNVFNTTPYIALPSGIISERGDLTIDMWCGMYEAKAWARFFDFGSSGKGPDAHNNGNGITSLEFSGLQGGQTTPGFQCTIPNGNTYVLGAAPFPLGTEQHVTLVYSYNQNVIKVYINGTLANSGSPLGTLQTLDDQNVWIGQSQWQDPILNGWISEFRIYEGAFTDADAAASETAGPNINLPSPISTVPTNIVSVVSGNTLTLSWPSDHIGWHLQVQTNALNAGLGTNWTEWSGAASTNQIDIPITKTNPSVFFRLVYP